MENLYVPIRTDPADVLATHFFLIPRPASGLHQQD